MMARCKKCNIETNNGTNFCSRKHRLQWIREHNIKGAKKFYSNIDNYIIPWGLSSSALDKSSVGG